MAVIGDTSSDFLGLSLSLEFQWALSTHRRLNISGLLEDMGQLMRNQHSSSSRSGLEAWLGKDDMPTDRIGQHTQGRCGLCSDSVGVNANSRKIPTKQAMEVPQ